ncbi:MAG: hypothetical protein IAX21_03950 [Candidatus Bathyarchaeota archaeon]|nr:MAG: hypothetical protein IAX21_03950 [Candidatus Bathyarchaeota archaeon]
MLTKKMAVTVLVALALSTTFIVFNQTFAQTIDPQKQKTETLIRILEENNITVLSAFNDLEQKNITPPETAQTMYNQGLVLATEAYDFLEQGNYAEASTKAVEAMKQFEETLFLLESALPSDSTPSTAEAALNLKANITRVASYIERLQNMAQKASAAGYNTLKVEKSLKEINNHLENATRKLSALDLEGASNDLCTSEALLDELTEHVSRLTNLVSESNAQRYLQAAEVRLSVTRTELSVSATLTPKEKEDALTALNNSETSLTNARDLIQDSKVDDAIEALEEAKRWEEQSTNAISAVAVTPSASNTNESLSSIEVTKAD